MCVKSILFVEILIYYFSIHQVFGHIFSLNGAWKFYSPEKNYSGQGLVPGDIYTDLFRNNFVPNPLYGEGDQDLAWVGKTKWTYEKIFDFDDEILKSNEIIFYAKGLDTVASVYLNDHLLFTTRNQFVSSAVQVKSILKSKDNVIRIEFNSPVAYAKQQANSYDTQFHHRVPPECPPGIFHGECNGNFIRKAQSSFSWDWGPSFPTVGISRSIFLEYFDQATITELSPVVTKKNGTIEFDVLIDVFVFCSPTIDSLVLTSVLPELNISRTTSYNIACISGRPVKISSHLKVPTQNLKLWYPNGYGAQNLYKLQVLLQNDGHALAKKSTKIGFRTVELIQDFVDENNKTKGRNFFFKVNNIPIFLKGSNFIPTSSFPSQNHTLRKKFLLESMREANMNALRIWGGGLYESDTFYQLADELGILLWHDLMFACALYPVDNSFMKEVDAEVKSQIHRLRHHPSILVWAGNNENELAIRAHWWWTQGYNEPDQVRDYVKLYRDLIKPIMNKLDPSRPYLLSSPSNGIRTEEEGGVANNPSDERYGDIHFYNEFINLWEDFNYQIPRCATEYGVQSIPLKSTMTHWINESSWSYGSKSMIDRQHHPGGIGTLLTMTFLHFEIPRECGDHILPQMLDSCGYAQKSSSFIDRFAYLTQVHQAIAMQVQSEHYRRWRGRIHLDGRGNTMCALYWQLNDVWAAPTWSSIDFDLNWKVLHYYARRFFAPVIVSLYLNNREELEVFVVSDKAELLANHTIVIDMMAWTNGFSPVYTATKSIDIKPLSSEQIDIDDKLKRRNNHTQNDEAEYVFRATLYNSKGLPVSPTATLLPDKLYKIKTDSGYFGNANVTLVKKISTNEYEISLEATRIVPVIWLDLKASLKQKFDLLYWFSDNAFVMTQEQTKVNLKIFSSKGDIEIYKDDITVCHVNSC